MFSFAFILTILSAVMKTSRPISRPEISIIYIGSNLFFTKALDRALCVVDFSSAIISKIYILDVGFTSSCEESTSQSSKSLLQVLLNYSNFSAFSLEQLRVVILEQPTEQNIFKTFGLADNKPESPLPFSTGHGIDEAIYFLSSQSSIIVLFDDYIPTNFIRKQLLMNMVDVLCIYKKPNVLILYLPFGIEDAIQIITKTIQFSETVLSRSRPTFSDDVSVTTSVSITEEGTRILSDESIRQLQEVAVSHREYEKSPEYILRNEMFCKLNVNDAKILSGLKIIQTVQRVDATDPSHPEEKTGLFCGVYTISSNHRAIEDILHTWGKKCDGFLAFSNATDSLRSIVHVVPEPFRNFEYTESYEDIWAKVIFIWKTIGTALLHEYEYFFLSGDDAFVIVENLKFYLKSNYLRRLSHNGTKPLYLGRLMHKNKYVSFHSGGSGYVLNRMALKQLLRHIDKPECLPFARTSMEDVMVSNCLQAAGVEPLNSHAYHAPVIAEYYATVAQSTERTPPQPQPLPIAQQETCLGENYECSSSSGSTGLNFTAEIFHPIPPGHAYNPQEQWYLDLVDSYQVGADCCSPFSVSFHYIRPPTFTMTCLHDAIYGSGG